MTTRSLYTLMATSAASLIAAIVVGGAALSALENVPLIDGVWQSFSVVSTTGVEGPTTTAGRLVAMGLFVWAVPCYLLMLFCVFSRAQSRAHEGGSRGNRPVIVERDVRRVVRSLHRN